MLYLPHLPSPDPFVFVRISASSGVLSKPGRALSTAGQAPWWYQVHRASPQTILVPRRVKPVTRDDVQWGAISTRHIKPILIGFVGMVTSHHGVCKKGKVKYGRCTNVVVNRKRKTVIWNGLG